MYLGLDLVQMEVVSSSPPANDGDCDDQDLSPDSEQELLYTKQQHPDSEDGSVLIQGQLDHRERLTLKKEITPLSGVGFVVGSLIGSGMNTLYRRH